MQELPVGTGVGGPLGLVLGEPDGDPLGLVLGELEGDLLGDDFVLLPAVRGLVVRGTAAVLVPVLGPVRRGALADPVPGDGRAAGFVALADDELTGDGSFDDAVRNAPVTSTTTSAVPVSRAAPAASAAPRRRLRCARASNGKMPVPLVPVMRAGTTRSAEANPVS